MLVAADCGCELGAASRPDFAGRPGRGAVRVGDGQPGGDVFRCLQRDGVEEPGGQRHGIGGPNAGLQTEAGAESEAAGPEAIALPSKDAKTKRRSLRGRRRRRTSSANSRRTCPTSFTARPGTRGQHAVTSASPAAAVSGSGTSSPFGTQFGAYADLLRNRVAQKWKHSRHRRGDRQSRGGSDLYIASRRIGAPAIKHHAEERQFRLWISPRSAP